MNLYYESHYEIWERTQLEPTVELNHRADIMPNVFSNVQAAKNCMARMSKTQEYKQSTLYVKEIR